MAAMASSSSAGTMVPVGFDGVATSTPAVSSSHAAGDPVRGELPRRVGVDGDGPSGRAQHAEEVAVARVAGVGQQHVLAGIDGGGQREQQRARGARGDDHALGCDVHAEALGVHRGDRLPQRRDAERRV